MGSLEGDVGDEVKSVGKRVYPGGVGDLEGAMDSSVGEMEGEKVRSVG